MSGKEFVNIIVDMYEGDELNNIINMKYTDICRITGMSRLYVWNEKRKAKAVKKLMDKLKADGRELRETPFVPMLMSIDSAEILKSAICLSLREKADV